jgi:hypothetical protein
MTVQISRGLSGRFGLFHSSWRCIPQKSLQVIFTPMDSRFHSIVRKWPDQHCQDSPRWELLAMGRIMQATNPFHSIDTSEPRSHGRHCNHQQPCHHHIQHQHQMCSSSRGGFQRRSGWPVAAGSQSSAMPSPSIQSPHDTLRAQEQSSVSMQYGGDPPPSHHTVSCLSHIFSFCLCLQDSSGKCVSVVLDIRSLLYLPMPSWC